MVNTVSDGQNKKIAFGKRVYTNSNHWQPLQAGYSLLGKPKKILVLSGSGADTAKAANGMCKVVEEILGPSRGEYEICGFYYPENNRDRSSTIERAQELLDNFLVPLIAEKDNFGDLKRLSYETACENMRNVVMFTHCYGSRLVFEVNKKLDEIMSEIGYSAEEIDSIHRQLFVAHHNNPRDDLGTTPQKSSNIYRITHSDERNKPCEYETDTFPQYIIEEQFTDDDCVLTELSETEHAFVVGRISKGVESEHNGGYWIKRSQKTPGARLEDELFCRIFREVVFSRYKIENLRQIEDRALSGFSALQKSLNTVREYGEELCEDFQAWRQRKRLSFGSLKQKLINGDLQVENLQSVNKDVLFLTDKNKKNLLDYAVNSGNAGYAEKIWAAMSTELRYLGEGNEELKKVYAGKPANWYEACLTYRAHLQKALNSNDVDMFSALLRKDALALLSYESAGEDTVVLAARRFAELDLRSVKVKPSVLEQGLNSLYMRLQKISSEKKDKTLMQVISGKVLEIQCLKKNGYIYS